MTEYDANNPCCVECGTSFDRPVRPQGGGSLKIYCSPRCRSNSWARGNTEKRQISVTKFDRKPESREKKRARTRKARYRKYGVTETGISALLADQGGRCRGCNVSLDLNSARIDHCHEAEKIRGVIKVRGLLCDRCNWALGHAKDDSAVLRRLAEYLDEQSTVLDRVVEKRPNSEVS